MKSTLTAIKVPLRLCFILMTFPHVPEPSSQIGLKSSMLVFIRFKIETVFSFYQEIFDYVSSS